MNIKKNKFFVKKYVTNFSFWNVVIFFLFLSFIYDFSSIFIKNYFLDKYSQVVVGHITDDKYVIANTKIVDENSYNYGYQFEIKDKKYMGNSHQRHLSTGTNVDIEYLDFFPMWNRIKEKSLSKHSTDY